MPNRLLKSIAALATAAVLFGAASSAHAVRDEGRNGHRLESHRHDRDHRDDRWDRDRRNHDRWDRDWRGRDQRENDRRSARRHDGKRVIVVPNDHWRRHDGRTVVIRPKVRPHRNRHSGYGWYRSDSEAYKWLSFATITLKLLDTLDDAGQRAHENAQIAASQARVGETIRWNRSGASGAVTVLRDGTSASGRYCREFQQTVTIGGRTELAYGTACQQPDGAWEIVSTDG